MRRLWTLMLVLLPLTMWGQGYWKQYDKKIHQENNGQYFRGVTMDGTYGRFSMKAVQEDDEVYSIDHSHCCKGEWLFGIITYTEPRKYYKAGEMLESTYQTNTTHSSPCDGVPFADGPSIHCYIYTGYDKERNICVNISRRAENENGRSWFAPKRSENHTGYKDITETVTAEMPQGSSNSIITVVFGFGHGNGEDGIEVTYYYKWTEGEMPLEEELFSTDEMLKQEKKSGPGKWIWIPVIIFGIGGAAGGTLLWIRRRRAKNVQFTEDEKDEIKWLHKQYQIEKEHEGIRAMDRDGLLEIGENIAWGLDAAGDVATGAIGAIGGPAGKVIQLKLTAAKSFLSGLSKDRLVDGEGFVKSVFMNLPKTAIDTAKAAFTGSDTFGGYSFGKKVGLNVAIDTVTSFVDDLSHGKDLGEMTKNAVKTAVKSTVGNAATTAIGDKVPWRNIARAKIADQALEKGANMGTDKLLDSFFNWAGWGD